MNRKALLIASSIVCLALWIAPGAKAAFGVLPGSVNAVAEGEDGTPDLRAGGHPFAYTVTFALNTEADGAPEGGEPRDLLIEVPSGVVGNPTAIPACTYEAFEGGANGCPNSTQIGILTATIAGLGQIETPIYNLVAPPGVATQFGVNAAAAGLRTLQAASIRTENGLGQPEYGVNVLTGNIPVPVTAVTATIWGTPADPGHTPQRGPDSSGGGFGSEADLLPFLTMPASCETQPSVTVKVDSKQNPGVFVGETAPMRDPAGNALHWVGCGAVPFNPSVSAVPTVAQADSPSGLNFRLDLPNEGLLTPGGIAETQPEKTEVVLPEGIAINPSAANGIAGCTLAQFNSAGVKASGCPDASKIGTLVANTPLLHEAIEGSVYLAQPHENEFDSLMALYIVARVKERGVLVKQAGLVEADPTTGQLSTTFDGLPPLPYSSFQFDLREGPRAPLITPQVCGQYRTVAKLYPFSAPETPVERTAPLTITAGAGNSACASSEAAMPNRPVLEAGSTAPIAGSYSPFVFRLSRGDGEQRFASISATLPSGLLGRIAGVPYCTESDIATAGSRTAEGGGALELASPSCPAASQVGTVTVAAGAGSSPYYTQGKAYLAGPYKGAPLSLEIIVPAIAGPFDLGSVAVRTALDVDLFSAQINAESDPLPTILHGIPLDVRTISLNMDRSQFTLNPTNCGAKMVTGSVTTLAGQVASLSNPFAVGGCKGLDFKPSLQIQLKGGTKRAAHPALKAVVNFPKGSGYANIAQAQVELPHSEFLDQGNLDQVCKQADLKAKTCPKSAVYGHAKAWSPLLDEPLEGPVYLGVGFGYQLPALVAELNGQIRVLLKGKVDTTKKQGLRNTFETVPDAPVSKFVLTMKGGPKYGLLVNSENLCRRTQRASVRFTAQSGEVMQLHPKIANGCGKSKSSGSKRHRRGA